VPLQIVLSLVAFLAGTLLLKNFDPSKLSLIIFKLRSKRIVRNLLDIVVGCNTGKLMTSCHIFENMDKFQYTNGSGKFDIILKPVRQNEGFHRSLI